MAGKLFLPPSLLPELRALPDLSKAGNAKALEEFMVEEYGGVAGENVAALDKLASQLAEFAEIAERAAIRLEVARAGFREAHSRADPGGSPTMTTSEVAARLGLGERRVRQLAKDHLLPGSLHGWVWLFQRDDVEAFARLDRPAHRPKRGS